MFGFATILTICSGLCQILLGKGIFLSWMLKKIQLAEETLRLTDTVSYVHIHGSLPLFLWSGVKVQMYSQRHAIGRKNKSKIKMYIANMWYFFQLSSTLYVCAYMEVHNIYTHLYLFSVCV